MDESLFDESAVRATYRYLHHTKLGVTEVRAIAPDSKIVGVGYFDSEDAFVSACATHNARANLYAGIQPRPLTFLKRSPNRIRRIRQGAQDRDIQWITALVIDIDPIRPKGSASTEAELALAYDCAERISDWIASRRFHRPVCNMSGNGVQLWFALPPHQILSRDFVATTRQLKAFEAGIREKFPRDGIKIDSIYNLSRIIKIIGTRSIKGNHSPKRPHRTSRPLGPFVRREDAQLLSEVMKLPVAAGTPRRKNRPAPDVPDAPDPWVNTLIRIDTRLNGLFHGTGKTSAAPNGRVLDRTSSGYDYSLILELARCGLRDRASLAATMRRRPDGHARTKGTAYVERTISQALKRAGELSQPRDTRPTISVTNRDMLELASDAWRAIAALPHEQRIYRRGGELVQIQQSRSAYRIVPVDHQVMRSLLALAAKWSVSANEQDEDVFPPGAVADFMISTPARVKIPEVDRISTVPYFDTNRKLIARSGYQARERTLLLSSAALESPWNLPDSANAREHLHKHLLRYFDFIDETDAAHLLALLLTPLASPAFSSLTPLFIIEAPVGTSSQAILLQMMATIICDQSTVPELSEMFQHNIAAALAGMPALLRMPEAGASDAPRLWRAVTARRWPFGATGGDVANPAIWIASGANPAINPQVARCSVRIRLAAPHTSPQLRDRYRGSVILQSCADNRSALIRSLLALWARWFSAKRPLGDQTLSSFEDWSETIGGVLACNGYEGFLATNRSAMMSMKDAWPAFFDAWWKSFRERRVQVSQLVRLCREYGFLDELGLGGGKRSQETRLGLALRGQRNRVIDGKQFLILASGKTRRTRYKLREVVSPK